MSCATFALSGCADFDEINRNPNEVSSLATKPYYALNQSIMTAQQNPDTAERLFVINWAAAARQDGFDGYDISTGWYDDGFNGAAYGTITGAIKSACNAINLANEQLETGMLGEHDSRFITNVLAFSRIWRTYLYSEFADSFGPMPVDGYKGVNPEFVSVRDVYLFLYQELAEAVAAIDTSVTPSSDDEIKSDNAYGFDPVKWKKFGISLWMRFAMRLSEAEPATAKAEFEKAVAAGEGITTADETFRIKEFAGATWADLSPVMSRTWNYQIMSATMANLTTNLGGAKSLDIIAKSSHIYKSSDTEKYKSQVKDAGTYAGRRFEDHYELSTDNPTKGFFFDGLPEKLDPRMFKYFFLPGDYPNRAKNGYYGYSFTATEDEPYRQYETVYKVGDDGNLQFFADSAKLVVNANFAWNGVPAGYWWDDKVALNGLSCWSGGKIFRYGILAHYPALSDEYRNGLEPGRVFFGPWETYFLLAEAAVRGWNAGTSAQAAYEAGIKASFDYNGFDSSLYTAYLDSEDYNRVGTSVKFTHTAEPVDTEMDYIDGYTTEAGKYTYKYPDASKILYPGHKLNDQLTKIITQKYIANTPWLPLENWSDHRRLGLPFFEIPASSTSFSDMPEWNQNSYQGPQKPGYYIQRMRYPSSLNNADPENYTKAVGFLSGPDHTTTPLWWAIGGH